MHGLKFTYTAEMIDTDGKSTKATHILCKHLFDDGEITDLIGDPITTYMVAVNSAMSDFGAKIDVPTTPRKFGVVVEDIEIVELQQGRKG